MSFEFDVKSQHSQRRQPPPWIALDRPDGRPSMERRSISSLLNGGSSRQSPTEKDHPSTGATPASHPLPITPHHEYPAPPPHYHAHSHSGEMRSGFYPPPAPRDHRPITAPIAPPPPGYYKGGLDRRHSYQPGPPPSDYFSPPQHSPPGPPTHTGHPYPPPPLHGPAPFYEASHAIPFETGARAPISRTTKACNGCRERKVRCDAGGQPGGGGVCSRCRESGRECKYSATQKKRGPMPGRAGRARRTSLEDGLLRQQPPSWAVPAALGACAAPSPPPPEYYGPRSPRSAPIEWWRQEWQDRDPREPPMHRDPREMESPRGRRPELYDPRERDPRDTRPIDPRVDPRAVDHRDPRAVDPRAVDPRDPRTVDPRSVDPRDPRAIDPRDPRAMDPRDPRADPRADPRLSPRARLSPRSVRLSPRELPYYSPRVSPRIDLRPELRDPRDPREVPRDPRDPREMPMPPPPHPHGPPHAGPPPPPHHERDQRWDMRPHPAAQWPWRGEVEGRR
ncbi:hypothetical protein A1Q2_02303 [Trichosporon asahii var. asahii CBS 8904]|uniref:Zn(2)-C6 fungal-type domain-containing protein n=1 Tax=Trichosporon asahii var. asahii (strain CBS 8904) TaxID=1220162 RepID=K1VV72_TRIAC|nr:hypothetical protein A1Q2_02303 [Trichosporon asahii var. asahii CBS 8904]